MAVETAHVTGLLNDLVEAENVAKLCSPSERPSDLLPNPNGGGKDPGEKSGGL